MIAVKEEKFRGVKKLASPTFDPHLSQRVVASVDEAEKLLLERVLEEPVDFVDNPMFHDRRSSQTIEQWFEAESEDLSESQARLMPVEFFDEDDRASRTFKSLSKDQEERLFLKLNYARYSIYKLLRRYRKHGPTIKAAGELLKWKRRELKVRAQLTQANIPLVLAMAKRSRVSTVDFSDLISEGNMALLRSIDKFDCSRGFKFSTYACRAILKSFSRASLKMNRYRVHFPVEFDPDLEQGDAIEMRRENTESHCVDRLRDALGGEDADLSDIERDVLKARFAVGDEVQHGPMTLEQVGKVIGVTKERVRQIQNKALAKLRVVLEDTVLIH